ncbi:MAG: YqjF family protein [Planctomycetaceae bacterium]
MSTLTEHRNPPIGPVIGYHKWRDLLFLHWKVPADAMQALVPPPLIVDTFDGWAWAGVVAFDMHGVRPWWFPALPGVSAFHETNVRTYVRCGDDVPGVWFFSLDAGNSLAVRVARRRWHLNYFRAKMQLQRAGNRLTYSSRRLWPESAPASYAIEAEIGSSIGTAAPDSFENFLVERYVLYSQRRDGRLFRGRVNHVPYPLKIATLPSCEQTLTAAGGIAVSGAPQHVVFSEGVDVGIGPLRPLPTEPESAGTTAVCDRGGRLL